MRAWLPPLRPGSAGPDEPASGGGGSTSSESHPGAQPPPPPVAAPDPDSDFGLMRRIAAGGDDGHTALSRLYERHRNAVVRFVSHLSRDPVLAEDAVHEVFLRVWRAAPRYEPRARFTTWLFQIAKNLWLTERDKRKRRPALGIDGPVGPGGDDGGPSSGGPPDPRPAPEDVASGNELQAAVRRAVDQLPEGQRLVVILADFQGLPYREVADILEIPVGTVKSRRHAADKKLRGLLADLGDALSPDAGPDSGRAQTEGM